jgi:hypothetical protein
VAVGREAPADAIGAGSGARAAFARPAGARW